MQLRGWNRWRDERGETLVELILAITIMGVVAISIGGAMTASIIASDVHAKLSTADYFLHNYAEALQTTTYTTCRAGSPPTPPNYVTLASLAAPTGFGAPKQTAIKFWTGTAFVAGCPGTDKGLQQVTLTLSSTDLRATESIVVVLRSP